MQLEVLTEDKCRKFVLSELPGRGRYTLKVKPSRYHLTHLFKHDSHSFHSGVLRCYLAVNVQRSVQDLSHFICVDGGVVLGQISVQLLDLVLQILNLRLESL